MKSSTTLFGLLKIYAVFWIIAGGTGLAIGLLALWQGKFDFPVFTLALLLGIGLLRQSRFSWQYALITVCVFFAFDIFLFLMVVTSDSFSDSFMNIVWGETELVKIPGPVFYPISLCLLAGQVWLLLSKPIRHYFSTKDNVRS
jgi:hypothetical protein